MLVYITTLLHNIANSSPVPFLSNTSSRRVSNTLAYHICLLFSCHPYLPCVHLYFSLVLQVFFLFFYGRSCHFPALTSSPTPFTERYVLVLRTFISSSISWYSSASVLWLQLRQTGLAPAIQGNAAVMCSDTCLKPGLYDLESELQGCLLIRLWKLDCLVSAFLMLFDSQLFEIIKIEVAEWQPTWALWYLKTS